MFFKGNVGFQKSFLMKVIYQALTKRLLYGYVSVDKPKVLFIAAAGAAAINIDGIIMQTTS